MSAPANATYQNGANTVSGDQFNTFVQWADSVSTLRSFIGLTHMAAFLEGISTPDDGGEGMFLWEPVVTQPDDGLNYIIPAGANSGGWVRFGALYTGSIPVISGALSAVSDAAAKAVLTSIISALVALGLATNGTS